MVAVVLLSATLHAGWNVAVRAGSDRRRESALLLGGGAVIAVAVLPFLPGLPAGCMAVRVASALLNGLYFILDRGGLCAWRRGARLSADARRGADDDAVAAWLLLGEALPAAAWLGIATICGGVVLLARRRGDAGEAASVKFALANAVVIAAYTLNDAVGVRISQAPLAYTLWMFPLSAVPALLWLRRSTSFAWPSVHEAVRGLGGAGASIGAYALVLWAMTRAPVAPVAALRETAILIGVVLARLLLGERPGRRGWGGAVAIAAGCGDAAPGAGIAAVEAWWSGDVADLLTSEPRRSCNASRCAWSRRTTSTATRSFTRGASRSRCSNGAARWPGTWRPVRISVAASGRRIDAVLLTGRRSGAGIQGRRPHAITMLICSRHEDYALDCSTSMRKAECIRRAILAATQARAPRSVAADLVWR